MDGGELSCPVCGEGYSDTTLPRNLACGHTFCTSCVQQMNTRDRRCPECRLVFATTSAVDLPVNYSLLRLARSWQAPPALRITGAGHEPDAGLCRAHDAHMYFWCDTCQKYVCRDCLVLEHKPAPVGSCRILSTSQALEMAKISQLEKSTTKGHLLRDVKLSITKHISELEDKRKRHVGAQEQLRLKAAEEDDKIQVVEREKEEACAKLTEIDGLLESLRLKEDNITKAKTMQEVSKSVQESSELLIVAGVFQAMEQQRQARSMAAILNLGSQYLVLELRGEVYASRDVGDRQQWAKVTLARQKLHLHDLQDSPTPLAQALIVPWESVRCLVPEDSAMVFMDFAVAGERKGRVYVTMIGNTPRARQFVCLCSGERGLSYRNNRLRGLYKAEEPGEFVSIEGCKNRDGTAAKALVDDLSCGGVYTKAMVPGLLSGPPVAHPHQTLFNICLLQKPNKSDLSGFGRVVSGVELLRTVSRHIPPSAVTVCDCGLVVPL